MKMEMIDVVIKIPKQLHDDIKKSTVCGKHGVVRCDLLDTIADGIVLPEGHGRIGDFDALIKQMDARIKTRRDNDAMWYAAVVETAINEVAQVLIEADGGGAE